MGRGLQQQGASMLGEETLEALSAEERHWLRARLRGRMADVIDTNTTGAVDVVEQEIDTILAELLARRGAAANPAPARQGWAQERDPRRRVVVTGLGIISSC